MWWLDTAVGMVAGAVVSGAVRHWWRRRNEQRSDAERSAQGFRIVCPVCGQAEWYRFTWINKLVVRLTDAQMAEWLDRNFRCSSLGAKVDFEKPDLPYTPKAEGKETGCGAKLTAPIMEHSYVLELFERKRVAEARNEEALRSAGVSTAEEQPKRRRATPKAPQ